MLLSDLITSSKQFPQNAVSGLPCIEVNRITHDSREVKKGDLFVALSGDSYDGHTFIQEAIKKGAAAVVGEQPITLLWCSIFSHKKFKISSCPSFRCIFRIPCSKAYGYWRYRYGWKNNHGKS